MINKKYGGKTIYEQSAAKKQNSADTSTEKRRKLIKEELTAAEEPITAVYLSEKFSVSRQIIVGDIAILRASGLDIT
ncbi:MAG: HTH domain-containing protein, partial [Anaerovoracaceae bacterium]